MRLSLLTRAVADLDVSLEQMRPSLLVACFVGLPFSAIMSQREPGPNRIPEELRRHVLNAPHPEYPYEARRQHLSGHGVVSFRVDHTTGLITSVEMFESTGSDMLDEAALRAAKLWRFEPRTTTHARVSVCFDIRGAYYRDCLDRSNHAMERTADRPEDNGKGEIRK